MNVAIGRSGRSMIGPCATIRSFRARRPAGLGRSGQGHRRVRGGSFIRQSVSNLIALIRKLSGVSVRLEERVRLPEQNDSAQVEEKLWVVPQFEISRSFSCKRGVSARRDPRNRAHARTLTEHALDLDAGF